MTRVDFYVLGSSSDNARLSFACRLTEKVFNLGQRVFIHSPSQTLSTQLDQMLWTFKAGAFVPHAPLEGAQDEPVVLSQDTQPDNGDWDVLINMSPDVPEFFSRYHRVAEVVDNEASRRDAGRQRFRFYRERGYEIHTHDV
ncbi:MAG: DNA polymerase III subunit chi [Gammaproteobacteria bacterium]